jgi:serine protease DegQ
MLKRFWLFFAQIVTVLLALLFIITTLKPKWLKPPAQWETPKQINSSYAQAVQIAAPAVVNVFSSKEGAKHDPRLHNPLFQYFFGEGSDKQQNQPDADLGSGVIVSAEGYILTDEHVVEDADDIDVVLADGRKTAATLIGTDSETDLAVLKINLKNLPTIPFAPTKSAHIGDVVLAVGNPFGIGQTVTMGIISALERNNLGVSTFENFIQTDASINPGNSGGALIDTQGRLLGINTAIYSRTGGSLGIGFAIPVSTARNVLDSIIATGAVTRGWIGIEPQDLTPEIAESFTLKQHSGAMVAGVWQNGPADKAGVRPGDIIVGIDGQRITDRAQLLDIVAQMRPKTETTLRIIRKNKPLSLTITIAKRPPPPKDESDDDD